MSADHAAEAEKWMLSYGEMLSEPDVYPVAETVTHAAAAQVHATLALVEQQRIANEQIAEILRHVTKT